MRDEWAGNRFEADLRDALHLELAGVRVGVAAPQVRGRIASRERARRTTRLVLLAAGLAAALLGGLVLAGRFLPAPPPGAAEPATIAAIDSATRDLLLARAWPDGRTEEAARYPGALDLLQGVVGFTTATGLPDDAVVAAGPDGRLAVMLPSGDVLVWASSNGETPSGELAEEFTPLWLGWTSDGRLARVGESYVRLLDPATGDETAVALPPDVHPDWMTGEDQLMAWTDDGKIVAERSDPASFASEVGTLDLAVDPPAFVPGLPASVRADTGREQRYASDGSWPGSGCQDDRLLSRCAGVASWWSMQSDLPTSTWYVTRSEEALHPVPARTADGAGLLLVTRSTEADEGRVIVVTAPGSWREAFRFAGPRLDTGSVETMVAGWSTIVGVAPGGRTIALRTPAGLVIGDLSTGATSTPAGGTVFVGWPTAPVVATERLAGLPACAPATPDDAAGVAVTAAGVTSPASSGALPVVGERQDADPFRRAELASAPAIEAEPGGLLALALPAGTCAEAANSSAMPIAGAADDAPVELGVWSAGKGTVAGLLPVVAPPPGDWVVRVTLWLDGADREAILLYRVVTPREAEPVATPSPSARPTPTPTPAPTPSPTPAGLAPDTVAVVVATEGLVMRSAPEISDTSEIYTPALAEGAELYLWDGPVRASGYDWYRVLPMSATYRGSGWVAAASRDGEPWIELGRASCPKAPSDVAAVASLPDGLRLACFPGDPITVQARITPCNCSVDPAMAWEPAWFGGVGHREDDRGFGLLLLGDPDASEPPSPNDSSTLWLHLDPSGTYPDPLPVGETVEVTGMFDHPAARTCAATLPVEPPEPQVDAPLWCRTSYVVTEIR